MLVSLGRRGRNIDSVSVQWLTRDHLRDSSTVFVQGALAPL